MPATDPHEPPTRADGSWTTAELFAGIAAGDDDAWRVAVARYGRLLLHVARRYRLTPEETADVVQETWARLVEHLADIRDPERVAGWLATTAARQSLAVCRARQREYPAAEAVVEGVQTWDVDDLLDARQRAAVLRRTVAVLPRRERRLLEAFLEPEPLTYAQISHLLSMPIGSIGPVRGRALRRLRSLLSDDDASFGPVPA